MEAFNIPGFGKKPLHEMTAQEVMAAMEWHDREAGRLKREADRAEAEVKAARGRATPDDLAAATHTMQAAIEALQQSNRLTRAVLKQCPPQYRYVPLKEGLPRWWGA
jgi:hypothetical protein